MTTTSSPSTSTSTCTTCSTVRQSGQSVTLQIHFAAGSYQGFYLVACSGTGVDPIPPPPSILSYLFQQDAHITIRLPVGPVTLLLVQRAQIIQSVTYNLLGTGSDSAVCTSFAATKPDGSLTGLITCWLYNHSPGSPDRIVGPPLVVSGQLQVSFPVVVQVDPLDQRRKFKLRLQAKSTKPSKFYGLLCSYDQQGHQITCYRSMRKPNTVVTIEKVDLDRKRIRVSPASTLNNWVATSGMSHQRSLGFYASGQGNALPLLKHVIPGQNCITEPDDLRPPPNQKEGTWNSCNPLNGGYYMLDIGGGWICLTDIAWDTFVANILPDIKEGETKLANHHSGGSYTYPIYQGALGSESTPLENADPLHVESIENWSINGSTLHIRPESCWIQPGMLVNWDPEDTTIETEITSIELITNLFDQQQQ